MIKTNTLVTLSFMAFASLAHTAPDLDRAMANPSNWAHARGQYNNQGYSALSQINTKNVKNLKLAWTFSTGVNRGHEGAPLVIDGVMYVHTAFPNNIYALDLNNDQKILWSYFPKQDPSVQAVLCCDNVNRGLAFGDGKIYLQQNNGVLVALNAKTGEMVWQTQVTDPKGGATNTNAPMVVKDKVLTGCAGGEFGVRCFMAAYYLIDGALAWKAYSTGPDAEVLIGADFNRDNPQYSALSVYQDVNGGNKQGGSFKPLPYEQLNINEPELGVRTWLKPQQEKDGWQHGGGAVTGYFGFDPNTNLVYYGTGNPGVWNPDIRPGDNKWASSVIARDVDTGMAKWAMQTTPHDEWDYDATNEVILFENNKKTYATQVNKNGFIYTWQANNGTLIAAEKVHPFVNWATSVDLKTGVPEKDARYNVHNEKRTRGVCPNNIGAKAVQPAAYSSESYLLIIPLNHGCMTYDINSQGREPGQPWADGRQYIGSDWYTGPSGALGGLMAWDNNQQKTRWYLKEKFPTSGVLLTKSDVAFYGSLDGWFKALNINTGKVIWQFPLGSAVVGNTFSYATKGKQFIGTYSGLGGAYGVTMKIQRMHQPYDFLGDWNAYGQLPKYNTTPSAGALHIFSL